MNCQRSSTPAVSHGRGHLGYNMLMFRDPSIHAACVGGDWSFGRIAPGRLGLKMLTEVNQGPD